MLTLLVVASAMAVSQPVQDLILDPAHPSATEAQFDYTCLTSTLSVRLKSPWGKSVEVLALRSGGIAVPATDLSAIGAALQGFMTFESPVVRCVTGTQFVAIRGQVAPGAPAKMGTVSFRIVEGRVLEIGRH